MDLSKQIQRWTRVDLCDWYYFKMYECTNLGGAVTSYGTKMESESDRVIGSISESSPILARHMGVTKLWKVEFR
jgi:hypothetical protein